MSGEAVRSGAVRQKMSLASLPDDVTEVVFNMNKYINKDAFKDVQIGDIVTRVLCGVLKMPLKITEVTDERIVCGAWTFDRTTGAEIDEELGWNEVATGSYIVKEN